MSRDVFIHFHGGREGIKRRFADLILGGLDELTGREAAIIETDTDCKGLFAEIVSGNLDVITWEIIEPICCGFCISADQGLGNFLHWDEKTAADWLEQMQEQQIYAVGDDKVSDDALARMFVGIKAIQEL